MNKKKMTYFESNIKTVEDLKKGENSMKRKIVIAGAVIACAAACQFVNADAAQAAKKYTISKTTKPCSSAYIRGKGYNAKSKNYFTIKSYLEKLKKQGGGTLVLKKGTYKICSTLTVPSNVTIQLKNGVVLKKTDKTGSKSLKAGKVMFKLTSAKAKDYKGTKKVVITSNKKATIDLGKVKNAVAIDMGHNYNVSISNLKFRNKNAGTYINIAGSRTVKVTNCTFQGNAAYTGGSYQAAVLINAYGRTPCKTVKVTGNTFTNLENGIRTTKYKKQVYSKGVSIQNNKFKNMTVSAVTGKMWTGAAITGNTIYRSDASKGTAFAFQLYSMTEPEISKNKIDKCRTPIYFGRASKIDNSISEAKISSMENNTVTDAVVYYVIQKHDSETRLLYFKDKNDKDFRITPETTPYRGHYETASGYTANSGQAKTYYVFRSYMEQLEYTGGGTITVAAGTYTLSHSVCIPSNVTVNFEDGVKIQKVKAVNTNLATNKTMFELVPPSKEGVKNSVGGYNGSQNVTLQGNGSTIFDCAYTLNAMAVVMGHAQNINIRNIAFTNENGSHFIELNSSKNVTVENCSFTDFKIYNNKSHKEAINVDTTDSNNNGFNYEWSNHDRTACDTVMINNCMFTNIGVAVGSHTYSVAMNDVNTQVYHENITIQNCKVSQTYNAGIRMLNWRNAVINNNEFLGIQGLEDNKGYNYTCILVKGAVNPTITKNTFEKAGMKKNYAVVIYEKTQPATDGAIAAGYVDTYSVLSEENRAALRDNTVKGLCYKRFLTKYADGTNDLYTEDGVTKNPNNLFNDSNSATDGDNVTIPDDGKEDATE